VVVVMAVAIVGGVGAGVAVKRSKAEAQWQLRSFMASPRTPPGHAPLAVTNPPTPTPTRKSPGSTKVPDSCPKGDPLCPTIQ
jgi:hypothetical protein